jgi:hypothetical protein
MTERVVLDANLLVANFRSGNAFKLLLEGARTEQLVLVIPELVIREAANKHREEAAAKSRDLEKAASGLDRLGVKVDLPEAVSATASTVGYEHRLRRTLREVNAVIAALPAVPHDKLLTKALDRRKPFAGSDAGYRDALLWESVLEQAAIGPTVFCTLNTRDFAETADKTALAAELVAELAAANLKNGVRLSTDLHALVRELVDVDVVAINEVERMLPALESALENEIEARLYDHEFRPEELRNIRIGTERLTTSAFHVDDVEILGAQVVHAGHLSHVDVEEVIVNTEDQLLLSLYVEIDADLDAELDVHGSDDEGYRYRSRTGTISKTMGVSVEATYSRSDETVGDVSISNVEIL